MAAARRRKPPIRDAIEHAAKGLDKTAELEVKYINSFKGRGVFAKAHFQKGDFVVEYRGELIHFETSRRRRIYYSHCAVCMFDFFWRERVFCIDAAQEDGSLGRLVNDDHCSPNCKMKKVVTEGKPHLFLFALRDIIPGEEITYDYRGTDWPWRKQVKGQPLARTTEQIPQGSPCSQMQVEGQPLANDSSETEMSRTTEQIPQGSPCSQMQGSDYPEPLPPKKNIQTTLSLVNYTDSDESQTSHPSSEPQCSLPEQDEYSAPRLKRTKSIQMNNQIHFNSDELYDPSDDSGEEYIPETSTDHSDDTDTSEVMESSDHKLSTPSNTELDQLADFLGHDIRVHRQFYRLPEGTLQLAKISKVLMALEQGRLSEFKGKTLDDISIDPEENVHLDSDTDVVCESDSQESQVSCNEREENETTIPDVSHVDAAPKQDTMTPPQARCSRSPKKDRGHRPVKRRMWDKEEIRAVETHMMSFITSCRVPGKSDCDKCLELEKVALKNRDWLAI